MYQVTLLRHGRSLADDGRGYDLIIASPLQRARRTAEIMSGFHYTG